jgi:hypothetical protein
VAFATLLLMIASFVLGVAVNGAWLYLSVACFAWLIVMAAVWVWAMATGRTGFFNRRL